MKLTREQAEQVKIWRVVQEYSYRMVAEYAASTWRGMDIISGNQIDGRELCVEAERVLNEDWVEVYGI